MKLKLGLTSAIALGFAGITYAVLKYRIKVRNAADVLNYLTIKIITTEEECEKVIVDIRRYNMLFLFFVLHNGVAGVRCTE